MIGYWAGLIITASLALLGMFHHWAFALPVFAIQIVAGTLAWEFITPWQHAALATVAASFFCGVFIAPAYGALYMVAVGFEVVRSAVQTWRIQCTDVL